MENGKNPLIVDKTTRRFAYVSLTAAVLLVVGVFSPPAWFVIATAVAVMTLLVVGFYLQSLYKSYCGVDADEDADEVEDKEEEGEDAKV